MNEPFLFKLFQLGIYLIIFFLELLSDAIELVS